MAADNPAEGSVLALGLVKPLHHTRDSRDSSVPDDSVLVSWYWVSNGSFSTHPNT